MSTDSKGAGRRKSTLPIALAYVAKHPGRYLFPLLPGRKGKPLVNDNLDGNASNDPIKLQAWHDQWPGCAWGCACKKSGIICLDIDCGPGKVGAESYKALRDLEGLEFPATEVQATPSGGRHAIYKGPHHFSQSKLGLNLDTPNYFVIAGCERRDGRAYTLYADKPAADAPAWLVERIKPRADRPRRERTADAVPLDWFKRALKATPYKGGSAGLDDRHEYGGWLNFAMACHEAAGGDEADYMWAFIDWSLDDPEAKESWTAEAIERHWQSFTADPPANAAAITRGSWLKLLNDLGQGDLAGELQPSAATDFATDPYSDDDWESLRKTTEKRDPISYKDFLFSLPDDEFIFVPSGGNKFWSGASVNLTCDGPPIIDPVLAREFKTHEAAKAFAKADAGWIEVEKVKVKRPKMTKAENTAMRDRFASGLDIDFEFDKATQEQPSDKSSEADPQPVLSDAQRRVRRLVILMGTTPQILRAWLLQNGIFMPNESWSAVARASAAAAIAGDPTSRVAEITWWPGKPPLLADMLIRDSGVIGFRGTNTFNRYRKPILKPGNFREPKPWLDHLKMLYPDDWKHFLQWAAWRVQHPEVKIRHCLVVGGPTRIGKDSLLEPVVIAVGPWNFKTTDAQTIMDDPKNNSYLEAVICIINESQDFGDENRFKFYDRVKPWLGGTATGVLMVADKYVRVHPVIDVWGAIITTNHKVRGLFLPPDDERHYVMWSPVTIETLMARFECSTREELVEKYFKSLHAYYANGGSDEVMHYLMKYPLDENFPMTPPPKTAAWHEIVNAYNDPQKTMLAEVLDSIGNPPAVSTLEVAAAAAAMQVDLGWFGAGARNTVPGQFEDVGYVNQRNPADKSGRWQYGSKAKRTSVPIYVQAKLTARERATAAQEVFNRERGRSE